MKLDCKFGSVSIAVVYWLCASAHLPCLKASLPASLAEFIARNRLMPLLETVLSGSILSACTSRETPKFGSQPTCQMQIEHLVDVEAAAARC